MVGNRSIDGATVEDGVAAMPAYAIRIAELERTVVELRAGMESRQLLGTATGLTMALSGMTPEEAWQVLVGLSSRSNVKVREVGRVLVGAHTGSLTPDDTHLVERIRPHLPPDSALFALLTEAR
jgi:hypothetical protein